MPDSVVACIGGGSNAIGLFHPFIKDESVKLIGVEAAGEGLHVYNRHAAALNGGRPGFTLNRAAGPRPLLLITVGRSAVFCRPSKAGWPVAPIATPVSPMQTPSIASHCVRTNRTRPFNSHPRF